MRSVTASSSSLSLLRLVPTTCTKSDESQRRERSVGVPPKSCDLLCPAHSELGVINGTHVETITTRNENRSMLTSIKDFRRRVSAHCPASLESTVTFSRLRSYSECPGLEVGGVGAI